MTQENQEQNEEQRSRICFQISRQKPTDFQAMKAEDIHIKYFTGDNEVGAIEEYKRLLDEVININNIPEYKIDTAISKTFISIRIINEDQLYYTRSLISEEALKEAQDEYAEYFAYQKKHTMDRDNKAISEHVKMKEIDYDYSTTKMEIYENDNGNYTVKYIHTEDKLSKIFTLEGKDLETTLYAVATNAFTDSAQISYAVEKMIKAYKLNRKSPKAKTNDNANANTGWSR